MLIAAAIKTKAALSTFVQVTIAIITIIIVRNRMAAKKHPIKYLLHNFRVVFLRWAINAVCLCCLFKLAFWRVQPKSLNAVRLTVALTIHGF